MASMERRGPSQMLDDVGVWRGPYESLTSREREMMPYLPTRLTNDEIAERMYVSVNTVKGHLKNIYRKLEVDCRDRAVTRAKQAGLLEGDIHRCSCGAGWVVEPQKTA